MTAATINSVYRLARNLENISRSLGRKQSTSLNAIALWFYFTPSAERFTTFYASGTPVSYPLPQFHITDFSPIPAFFAGADRKGSY